MISRVPQNPYRYQPERSLRVLERVLAIGREGLMRRRLDEEVYLRPLEHRLATRTTNTDEIIATYKKGGIPLVLERHRYDPRGHELQRCSHL